MTKKDIVTLVKEIFSRHENKFAEAKLEDGTLVMTPAEFEVGADLFVVGEEENVAAPDGEHKLEDGTVVKSEGGKITEIVPVKVEQEELEEDEKEEEKLEEAVEGENKEIEEVVEVVEDVVEDKIKELTDALAIAIAKIEELEGRVESTEEAAVLIAEEFGKMPGGDKINFKKTGFSDSTKKGNTKEDKLNDLFNFVKTNKRK